MTKSLNLALQGGGAHGAFAWGVLDRLLEEDLNPQAISYTRQQAKDKFFSISSLERRFKALRFHLIESGEVLSSLEQASKYDTRQEFLLGLKEKGRNAAEQWIGSNFSAIGQRPSCDIEAMFL
ncbi:hypothetical protein ACMXYO_01830 [Neptuniibacter sp. QD37_6]|uniref:hypothetical protein n=1 Tax=Neptuniibacter sp. QD37_6 TaxID=3398210 RepID=UPI0039F5B60C